MVLESFLIYNLVLLLVIILCIFIWITRRTHEINPAIFYFAVLFIIILFSGLRYDVGTDYYGHLEDFVYKSYSKFAPAYLALNRIFLHVNYGFFWVIIIASVITYLFVFEDLRLKGIDYLAIPIFICLFLFQFNNLIRQAIAISIFFYSIRYIHLRNPIAFFALVLLAASFHSSALFLFPLYFINRLRINRYVALLLIFVADVLINNEGLIVFVLNKITGVPYYGHYVFTEYISSGESNTGLGYLAKLFIGIILLLKKDPNNSTTAYNTYYNLFAIGIILMPVANKIAVVDRIDYYFFIAILFILPYYIKSVNKNVFDYALKFILLLLCLAFFEAGLYFNTGKNSPYRTIFTEYNTNILTAP